MEFAQYKLCLTSQFLDYSLTGEGQTCGCVRLPTFVVWGSSELLCWAGSLAWPCLCCLDFKHALPIVLCSSTLPGSGSVLSPSQDCCTTPGLCQCPGNFLSHICLPEDLAALPTYSALVCGPSFIFFPFCLSLASRFPAVPLFAKTMGSPYFNFSETGFFLCNIAQTVFSLIL